MPRGFTLLEMLIMITVCGILLNTAIPSFQRWFESHKMQRLANQLHHFMIHSKSQAVLRRERLWAHTFTSEQDSTQGEWRIDLTNSSTPEAGRVLSSFSGQAFTGIAVSFHYVSDQISFGDVHGRPSSGNIRFYPTGSPEKALKVISHTLSGRVRICSDHPTQQHFGYPLCL
ncbi:pilus assembly protein FimT [Vibrio azureus]|uniref:Type II secretion system protein H n=1 Tax=Vibrio azureus NBRC 104587 TaxID=1219077 RepID=U3AQ95_9VIBR|nr:GspH/FimT family pseudopilin [Vibrio azureus]AUI85445.1 pilus assembly protein FimT [Vibrio azureus]GAD75462.1 hypothetical protein VAZ01S_025_00570 [Vibrio azureus NBRC 104587]